MMNQTDSQSDSINEEKPLSHASSSRDYSKGPNLPNMDLLRGISLQVMNQTDSQSDSISEEKPLSLDQQQQPEMNNAVDSHASSSSRDYSKGPNLPNMDVVRGSSYLEIAVPLYKASIKGGWEAAEDMFKRDMELVRYSITDNGETSLHVAASTKSSKKVEKFVKNLVKLMTKEDLALENRNFNTALFLAAACGNIKTVKTMMKKNETLHAIPGGGSERTLPNLMPLYPTAFFGNYEVVKYLYEKSNDLCDDDGWNPQTRSWFLEKCVEGDMFALPSLDIALKVMVKHPNLGIEVIGIEERILSMLAQKPEAFQEEKSLLCGFSVIGLKARPLEKEPKALQLLKIIWYYIAKRPEKEEIDDIMRGQREEINGEMAHPSRC